eukprot:848721-Prorocentrum_minimum.AAC.1
MDPTMKAVPVIDISPFLTGADAESRHAVVRAWDRAFSSVGFAVIVGHGIPEPVIEEAYDIAKRFFGLPEEEKMGYCFGKGYGAGGYTPVGGERVSATQTEVPARPPDLVENLLIHKRASDAIPQTPENYKEIMYRLAHVLKRTLHVVHTLRCFCKSLAERLEASCVFHELVPTLCTVQLNLGAFPHGGGWGMPGGYSLPSNLPFVTW